MPVSLDFVSPPQLVAGNLHGCLRAGDPEARSTIINLRAVNWVDPAGLVALALFIESQWSIGRTPRLYGPSAASRARYLKRMHVGELVESMGGTHDLPEANEWDQDGQLLELQRFDGIDGAAALASLVERQLSETESGGAIHKSICEIGANVPDHSGRDHGYIAAVTTHASTRVSFAVGDAGVGLLEPLQRLGYSSHSEVIQDLFFRPGVSRFEEAGRGRGVFRTKELVTDLGGSVYMTSGPASVRANHAGMAATMHVVALPGTLLQGEMRC